jgi:nucleoid-associated protein YgaU
MSVATELPPVVFIPERARSNSTGAAPVRQRLQLVPDCGIEAQASTVWPLVLPLREPARTPAPLRLTRRGLVVLSAGVVLLGLTMLAIAYLSFPSGSSAARPAQSGVVTVQSGDTLWSIARRVAPGRDPRAVVDDLRSRNHLTDVSLTPGQTLNVG